MSVFVAVFNVNRGGCEVLHTVVAKAKLKSCKDPIVASAKARKSSLKPYNQMKSKLQTAILQCEAALTEIHDDYDCQDYD